MPAGRPLKFKSVEEFNQKVEAVKAFIGTCIVFLMENERIVLKRRVSGEKVNL